MKTNTILLISTCFIVLMFFSCEKDQMTKGYSVEQANIVGLDKDEGLIVIGQQLEDPYNIKNMKQAYSNLKSANTESPDLEITPTHKYLRFLPKDDEEWSKLKSDTTIVLYDFPLDYEITEGGTAYHDPTLPDSAITWQYCVLPIDYEMPNIEHELIYNVFIPSEEDSTTLKQSSVNSNFLAELEYESTRITGNLSQNDNNLKSTSGLWSQWRPKGTIKVWDDILGDYLPLYQVSVHARWYTRIETDLTDENGYFETGKFRNRVNYSIKWERSQYEIRDGMITQAWYNGPRPSKDTEWHLKIEKGSKSIMYATIHRAAYVQFYGNNGGIRRPTTAGKTKICYIDKDGTGICWGDWPDMGVLPDIKVWGKSKGVYKPTDQIFATTIHELGHLSHWYFIGPALYAITGEKIYESWADAIECVLTTYEYRMLGAKYNIKAGKDYVCKWTNQFSWPNVTQKEYSPIFIDLIDNDNQRNDVYLNGRIRHYGNVIYPNDLIFGYSLLFIQNNMLMKARGYSSLRDEVKKHKIAGVTDAKIDELFELYWSN